MTQKEKRKLAWESVSFRKGMTVIHNEERMAIMTVEFIYGGVFLVNNTKQGLFVPFCDLDPESISYPNNDNINNNGGCANNNGVSH